MSRWKEKYARFLPWSGLAGGFLGLAIVHQWGSDGTFDDCGRYPAATVALILLLGLAVVALGAIGSLSIVRHHYETPERRFVAMISLGSAALFTVAMILPTLAALIIPTCFG